MQTPETFQSEPLGLPARCPSTFHSLGTPAWHLFHHWLHLCHVVYFNICDLRLQALGTDQGTKTDDFLEKFQKTFALSPPHFEK